MICYICEKEFKENQFGIHLRVCKKTHNQKEDLTDIKYKQLCFHYKSEFKKEFFEKEYIDNTKSVDDISKILNISNSHVLFLLKYYKIERRNIKEASNTKRTREKYKSTCKEKYGSENISGSEIIKNKKKQTFMNHYGVDNIFKDEDFKKWLVTNNFSWNSRTEEQNKERVRKQSNSIKKFWKENNKADEIKKENKIKIAKFLSSMSEEERRIYNKKKGVWWHKLNDEQKSYYLQQRIQNTSKLETKISEILILLGIPFTTQKFINKISYDFLISNTKILIEVQGDFWHGNPEIYKENDILHHPMNHILTKDQWKKDEEKRINAEKYGYKVIYIWEKEMAKKSNTELIELLIKKLKS